ncbi:MAG: AI-2E family transporter [Planctomycetaceae bacterium]|nr:AI-2E family transporter [Planctomycetaceae bacterium]
MSSSVATSDERVKAEPSRRVPLETPHQQAADDLEVESRACDRQVQQVAVPGEAVADPIAGGNTTATADGGTIEPSAAPPRWSQQRHQQQQSVALTIIATLAVLYTLAVARAILFPVVLAFLFFLTLRPLVRSAERRGINPLLSSVGILIVILATTAGAVVSLVGPADVWFREAPARMQVVGQKLSGVRHKLKELTSMTDRLQDLATGEADAELAAAKSEASIWDEVKERISGEQSSQAGTLRKEADAPIAVEVRQPQLIANLQVLNSAGNIVGNLLIVFVLGFFLLVEGDVILNNLLGVMPRFTDKKQTVRLISNIERGISTYLLTVTIINVCLGGVIATVMWLLGVPNAPLWGVMAASLNFIPYIGALTGVVIVFLVAVFSFDSLAYASLAPLVYLGVTVIEGNFITPALVGRQVSLNSVAVLLSLIVWGWLWGIGGALIGVPILIVFKLVCDQFEKTASIGALLEGR